MKMCKARYGWEPSHSVYQLICDQVWAKIYGSGSERVEQVGPHNAGRYFVQIAGSRVLVAWSDVTLQIATFLPVTCEISDRGEYEDGGKYGAHKASELTQRT